MYGDLKNYFYKKIVPEYKDYMESRENKVFKNNNDARIGLISAVSLYHLREHLPESMIKHDTFFVSKCSDYSLLRDLANVSKHKNINRNKPQISDLKNIKDFLICTVYQDVFGEFSKTVKEVEVTLDNGKIKLLSTILTNCMNMWGNYLYEENIITEKHLFQSKYNTPSREKDSKFDMGAIQGLTFSGFKMQLLKYNYQKKIAEPIDLTNANIQWRVYLPEDYNEYDIMLHIPESNQKIEFTVKLNNTEVEELELYSKEERIKKIIDIAKSQGSF